MLRSIQQVEGELAELLRGYHKIFQSDPSSNILLSAPIFSGSARGPSGLAPPQQQGAPQRSNKKKKSRGSTRRAGNAAGAAVAPTSRGNPAQAQVPSQKGPRRTRSASVRRSGPSSHVIVSSQMHVCGYGAMAGRRRTLCVHCPACNGAASSKHMKFLHREELHERLATRSRSQLQLVL